MKIIDSILTDAASIAAIRKDIHAHPELCFQEVRTADVVAKQLTDWGIPIHRGMGTTGVIGIVQGLSLIPISEPTRLRPNSYAGFFLKKKNKKTNKCEN